MLLILGSLVGRAPLPAGAQSAGEIVWLDVSAGQWFTCGIASAAPSAVDAPTSGRLYCWGKGDSGRLGTGSTDDEAVPVEIEGGGDDWVAVDAGVAHACGLRASGRLYCWGADRYGQLGDGAPSEDRDAPVEVLGGSTHWRAVGVGGFHTCGIRASGRLLCWGADDLGQVGDGGARRSAGVLAPIPVAGPVQDWSAVTAGDRRTCALRPNGQALCWGRGVSSRLVTRQPLVIGRPRPLWQAVVAGADHTCALTTGGRVFCQGYDDLGQQGDGIRQSWHEGPVVMPHPPWNWVGLGSGYGHVCGIRRSGRLFCWGWNRASQLGNGDNRERTAPAEVSGGADDWVSVDGGYNHTCGLRAGGTLWCWGGNGAGQIGDGAVAVTRRTPVQIPPPG